MSWAHVVRTIQRHRVVYGILIAIGIGLLMTVVSMSLYISSGASRLDLSRPGYEKARTKVAETREPKTSFDVNGPMNVLVVDQFQKLFTGHRTTLTASDGFDSAVLDDASLHLNEQPQ